MRVAVYNEIAAGKKEPVAALLERVHGAFLAAGLDEPKIEFSFADAPAGGSTSSVSRVLRRFPQMQDFAISRSPAPGTPAFGILTNAFGDERQIDFATILAIASGVPKSFPFNNFSVQFYSPAFGEGRVVLVGFLGARPGIGISDSWWINGRQRSMRALTIVKAEAGSKTPRAVEGGAADILAACGKITSTSQTPLADSDGLELRPFVLPSEVSIAIAEIFAAARAQMAGIIDRAHLPHDLPSAQEALKLTSPGAPSGAMKPALVSAFKPMGYSCRGDSGTFTLRRRTKSNLAIELYLDVGMWSRSVTTIFKVHGLGFAFPLNLPVSRRAIGSGQYRIGGPEHWQQIVENLAALVADLDHNFVTAVEAASGPSPTWYHPAS